MRTSFLPQLRSPRNTAATADTDWITKAPAGGAAQAPCCRKVGELDDRLEVHQRMLTLSSSISVAERDAAPITPRCERGIRHQRERRRRPALSASSARRHNVHASGMRTR